MVYGKPEPKSELEKLFFYLTEKGTPLKIKENPVLNINNKNEFTFTLTKEHLEDFEIDSNKLGILKWLQNYKREAMVSTAGIRGPQNPLYPWDTRYPINLIGVLLATVGKALVLTENKNKKFTKVCAGEVRYNTDLYIDLISRVQAYHGIKTLVTDEFKTIPMWMASFLIFFYDLDGGEYVTSSHAISKKTATKDLNSQGSQFVPDESLKFVEQIEKLIEIVKKKGSFDITIASRSASLIDRKFLKKIDYGNNPYCQYLKKGVATETNIDFIKSLRNNIIVECMGGCMYRALSSIFKKLGIYSNFDFIRTEEDPFYHQIGKIIDEKKEFFDLGCDATIVTVDKTTNKLRIPVVETMNYSTILRKYPIGSVILMTDPDGDRLVTGYIDKQKNEKKLKELGLISMPLNGNRIFVMFTPNQSFLMTFDFQAKSLKKSGNWEKYNWFIIKTTASAKSWDEWAEHNNVNVINTPVGFKEISSIMLKVENELAKGKDKPIVITDVFGNKINLGKKPRLLFAGEESGGEIFGPRKFIKSKAGRIAISMREKSAGEAIIITSAMVSWLEKNNMSMYDYLKNIYQESKIKSIYDIRIDQKYYNENESDIEKLTTQKDAGMRIRTKNDMYFLSLALGYKDKLLTLDDVKSILSEAFTDLKFDDLLDIKFVGDGTYLLFRTKYVEVRPSGTDAVNKAYSSSSVHSDAIKYSMGFTSFNGNRNPLHVSKISDLYYETVKDNSLELYEKYLLSV